MATVRDKILVDQLRKSAKTLRRAASWAKSGLPLKLSDDFIFELYLLFELMIDLQKTYDVKYEPGKGNLTNQFPRKPANKTGRPKFEVYRKLDGSLLWQICAGTKIADINGDKRSPDISFQNANAPDEPCFKDIELIWDAKYRHDPNETIAHPELSAFAHWLEVLQLRNKTKPTIILHTLAQFVGNCLVTNGRECSEMDVECKRLDLKEVTSFYPGKIFSVRP